MIKKRPQIILGSSSPRRRELLSSHFRLKIIPADVDERRRYAESPLVYVARVSREKWAEVRNRVLQKSRKPVLILTADTTVRLGSKIFGKPRDAKEARKFLRTLSGRAHEVLSSVHMGWSVYQRPTRALLCKTRVCFRQLSSVEIERYIRSKDWKDKAGGYAIQGKAWGFASSVDGSLTNVIGLPLDPTLKAIAQLLSHPPS